MLPPDMMISIALLAEKTNDSRSTLTSAFGWRRASDWLAGAAVAGGSSLVPGAFIGRHADVYPPMSPWSEHEAAICNLWGAEASAEERTASQRRARGAHGVPDPRCGA